MVAAESQALDSIAEWETDPDAFMDAIQAPAVYRGSALTPQQRNVWQSVIENKRTACKSGNGTGKDWLAARIAVWYAITRGIREPHEAIVLTSSPQEKHLKKVLWGEIRSVMSKALEFIGGTLMPGECEWYADRLAYPKWFLKGIVANVEGAFSGYRAAHVMIILDEACDIPEHIWEAVSPMISGLDHKLLAIGNPVKVTTGFYGCFSAPTYSPITLSSRDCADYGIKSVAGMATHEMIADLESEYGEGSGYVSAHVDGEFPEAAADQTFPLSWIEAAEQRNGYEQFEGVDYAQLSARHRDSRILGVDPAGGVGGDRSVIVVRDKFEIVCVEEHTALNPMQLVARIVEVGKREGVIYPGGKVRPRARIVVDSVGNDVATRLKEFGILVDEFKGGSNPRDKRKYRNRRTEGYFAMRQAINPAYQHLFSLKLKDKMQTRRLREELHAQRHTSKSDSVVEMEKKDEIKKRLKGKSPDIADALSMTFAPSMLGRVW